MAESVNGGSDNQATPPKKEMSMEMRVAATPGFTPAPFAMKQCFTVEDARDPARLMGQVANPGATGCTFSNRSYSGNTLSFTMQCAGTLGIASTGQVTFTSDTMEGSVTATANVGGTNVETQNKVSARRLGGC